MADRRTIQYVKSFIVLLKVVKYDTIVIQGIKQCIWAQTGNMSLYTQLTPCKTNNIDKKYSNHIYIYIT